jgi:hypothetical protein
MGRVQQAQAWFEGVEVLTTVENTFQPRLNGKRRKITKLGKTFFDGVMIDDVDERLKAGGAFYGRIPTRASDVVAISDTEITLKIGRDEHTVTYSKERTDA